MRNLSQLLIIISFLLLGKVVFAADTLSLAEAMGRAEQSNPAIRSQQAMVSRQILEQDIARSQHLPRVDLNAAYTHYAYPSLVTPIRQIGVFPPLDKEISNIGMAISLPLYSGGKLVAGESMAAHNSEAAVQTLRANRQDLLFNVVSTYTKALHFKKLVNVLDSRIKALQQEEKDIELRIGQGRAAKLELIRVQTQLSQVRYDKISAAQGEKNARSLLSSLLGEGGELPILTELGITAPALPASVEKAIDQALLMRPEILRLNAMGKAAQQKIVIAHGESLPQINLVTKVQESAGGGGQSYNDWQMGVQLSLPLFDGKVSERREEQASLEQKQTALLQEDALNRLATEIEQAFGALTEARAKLEAATQGETEATEALRIEILRYHGGENTITDLLSAESALWLSTANRLQAMYDVTVGQARLLHVTGELTSDSFQPFSSGVVSSLDPSIFAQYFSWHRHAVTSCVNSFNDNKTEIASPCSTLIGANFTIHTIKQGAML